MAYYLYKKLRDKKRNSGEEHLLNQYPVNSNHNGALAGAVSATNEMPKLEQQPEDTREEKQVKKAARKYRWRLIGGLFLPATVQALNTTLIAGALVSKSMGKKGNPSHVGDMWRLTLTELTLCPYPFSCQTIANLLPLLLAFYRLRFPPVRTNQLDYNCLQSHSSSIHSGMGPIRRYIRTLYHAPSISRLRDLGKRALRGSTTQQPSHASRRKRC
jgi:hypothetical protein